MEAAARSRFRIRTLAGAAFLALVLVACVATLPWTLAREDNVPRYNAGEAEAGRLAPSWTTREREPAGRAFALGSDALGRSVLVRCLTGGGISLTIGLAAAGVSVVIGTLYGGIAGYAGGRVDSVMMRVLDVLFALPYVLLVVLLAVAADAVLERRGPGLTAGRRTMFELATLLAAIGGVSWLTLARVVRGQVLSLKERAFVEAARAMGGSPARVFVSHILPNLSGAIIVYATLSVPQAMLQESFLSFLGIGVRPPVPSWGNLVAEGLSELNPYRSHWWLLLFPCVLLGATLVSLNLVGEALRARLDPTRGRVLS
jgi:ABC-type dipeptide/oligopeptide/nickel transport system permease subunit